MLRRIHAIVLVLALVILAESIYLIASQYRPASPKLELSAEEQAWLETHGQHLRVSAIPDLPPIAYIEDGQIKGLLSDYYRLIEQRLGVRFDVVVPRNLAEMLAMAEKGQVEIVGPVARTDSRSRHLLFTQPLVEYPAVVVVPTRLRDRPTLESLRGHRIAVTRDYAIWPYLRRNYPFHDFVAVANDRTALKLVAFGQVDAAVSDVGNATEMIKQLGYNNLMMGSQTGFSYVLRIASNRNQPLLNSILSKTLASVSRQEKERIHRRWIKVELGPMFTGRRTAAGLLVLSLALLVLLAGEALWNKSLTRKVSQRTAELRAYQDSLADLVAERTRELSTANRLLSDTNAKLSRALAEVKTLSGFIPICSYCKKVRDDQGYWKQVEDYIASHSNAEFSHGLCPDCLARLYPEFEDKPALAAVEPEDSDYRALVDD